MKVLFVENKHQTYFWREIAAKLRDDGDEVSWIVQNIGFLPDLGCVHAIPYPNRNGHSPFILDDPDTLRIVSTDRGIHHFGGDASHYGYYENRISKILDAVLPDVVFGEATLFHELLCIRQCKARHIPYLNPTSCRYPIGRFSFYVYDIPMPFAGSGEQFGKREAEDVVDRIARREVRPDYMNGSENGWARSAYKAVLKNLHVTLCRLSGERYNTPSPACKLSLGANLWMNKRRWEEEALRARKIEHKFRILYPLQMQPESNIDVWGSSYRDQVKLLAAIRRIVGGDAVIVVKPNPKSKYELSEDLIRLVASTDGFHPLSHATTMKEALQTIDLVVTVTGTIAIEAIFSRLPVVTLIETLNNTVPQCVYLKDLASLPSVIHRVQRGTFPLATKAQKISFLDLLTRTSYKGIISNPYSTPSCVSEENIRDVHYAFRDVLRKASQNLKLNERWKAPLEPRRFGVSDEDIPE